MSDEQKQQDNDQSAGPSFSLDDVKSIVSKSVNAAITQRLSQYDQKLEETLATQMEQLTATLKPEETDESPEAGDEVKAMRARLKEMEALLTAEKQERDKERQLRNVNEERAALREALQAEGVPPERVKAAVAVLYTEDKRVGRDEDGNIQFLTQEREYVDRAPLKEGVAKFLKTDEGKIFMPARDVAGSGNRGGKAPKTKADGSLEDDIQAFANLLWQQSS